MIEEHFKACVHSFFLCQVPSGDSCQPIYHKVCRKCRYDETESIIENAPRSIPHTIWIEWAIPQIKLIDGGNA